MPILPDQRVGVFLDVQNMYYSARALYGAKVDFGKVLEKVVRGRKLVRAIAYVIRTDSVEMEQSFFDALEARGFEIREKDLQIFYGGAKKGDWDIGIAMDVIRHAPKLDAVIIVSGDGDFKDLMTYAKAFGCHTEAAAFMESSSIHLREEVDEFINLTEMKSEVLIKGRPMRRARAKAPLTKKSVAKKPAKRASVKPKPATNKPKAPSIPRRKKR